MLRLAFTTDGVPKGVNIVVEGVRVFLDYFAIKKLAKEDPDRRRRFVEALHKGGDLVFSISNAVELVGPTGGSFDKHRAFLSDLGAHWFVVEMDPKMISDRELAGASTADSFVCKKFMNDFFNDRSVSTPRNQLLDYSDRFFDLGWVMHWLQPQRASVMASKTRLDDRLRSQIARHRASFDRDPAWIDTAFPLVKFNSKIPATFTYSNLMRTLIAEAKCQQIKKNDGIDFGQAVIASSIASLATLDKHWKRRINTLPERHRLAHIYEDCELDLLVDDLEHVVL
jgi:hypothetical protein